VVPARSFRHRLSPDPQPSWPLSGRNSTHRPVQIRRANSVILVLYLVNMLPIDGRAKQIVDVIVIIIGIISLLKYLTVF
jgi:hypothetical protein